MPWAIVQVMGGHCGSEGVQREGCGALGWLAVNLDNAIKIGAGWRPLCRRWAGTAGVRACLALTNLAKTTNNKVKIGAGGGVEAIVQAMGGHCGSKGVQNAGCTALWSLGRSRVRKFGFGNSDYRERERERERETLQRIKRAGAEEAVQDALMDGQTLPNEVADDASE